MIEAKVTGEQVELTMDGRTKALCMEMVALLKSFVINIKDSYRNGTSAVDVIEAIAALAIMNTVEKKETAEDKATDGQS